MSLVFVEWVLFSRSLTKNLRAKFLEMRNPVRSRGHYSIRYIRVLLFARVSAITEILCFRVSRELSDQDLAGGIEIEWLQIYRLALLEGELESLLFFGLTN